MGAIDTRNMSSNFAVNKNLHTVAACWILLIQSYDARNHEYQICSMIPTIYRTHNKPKVNEGPVCRYICRSKSNLLSSTLPTISRNTTTIFRLPRCLHHMKHYFVNRINNLICKSYNIFIHYMRKNFIKPTNLIPYTYKKLGRMITKLYMFRVSNAPIIRSTSNCNCSFWYRSYHVSEQQPSASVTLY